MSIANGTRGVIALFHKHLVKPNLFPKKFNTMTPKLKKLREDTTYADKVTVKEADARRELEEAEAFLKAADEVLARLLAQME